ncbi:MAG TPA: Fe-S cluster assembly protein SufD [Azospirillaceae bacterium]|nr:Fe-S cluster assembly protein SufD [Azospirillaceae bacterium]
MMDAAPNAIQPYLDALRAAGPTLPGAGLPWLDALRAAGAERFRAAGFPGPRVEAWKYTNLRPLEKQRFAPAAAVAAVGVDALPTVAADGATPLRLVFVDGRHRPELSSAGGLPAGATLESLADALARDPAGVEALLGRTAAPDGLPLVALNTAFVAEGAVLRVRRGTVVEQPVELVFVGTGNGAAWHPRLLVQVEDNAEATLVEHHVGRGDGAYFSNVATEITVGQGAVLRHYKVQEEGMGAFHLATTTAKLGRDSTYDTFVLTTGARLSRNEIHARLDGTGVTCRVSGAYTVRGEQHTDFTSLIDHAQPRCTSREVVKGAIDGRARAVFQGKIVVRPDAQKTDGYQLNRALLLSDQAEIDSKPELEIYADDVKCSHGATAGELDDDALFYLRARGIPLEEARGLLIASFLDEAVEEIGVEPVREHFRARINAWLAAR